MASGWKDSITGSTSTLGVISLGLDAFKVKRQVVLPPLNMQKWNRNKMTTINTPILSGEEWEAYSSHGFAAVVKSLQAKVGGFLYLGERVCSCVRPNCCSLGVVLHTLVWFPPPQTLGSTLWEVCLCTNSPLAKSKDNIGECAQFGGWAAFSARFLPEETWRKGSPEVFLYLKES